MRNKGISLRRTQDIDREAMRIPGTDAFFTEGISETAESKVILKSAT